MHSNNSAFSLIELMVAIAIIALLTAIATPVYVSYTIKSKVSSALPILESLKTSVSEYYTANGTFPSNLGAIGVVSYSDNIIASTNVTTTACPAVSGAFGCVQTIFSSSTTQLAGNILSLVLVDNGGVSGTVIQWVCLSGDNTGANKVNAQYLPKSCQ